MVTGGTRDQQSILAKPTAVLLLEDSSAIEISTVRLSAHLKEEKSTLI